MTTCTESFRLDVRLKLGHFLLDAGTLDKVQFLLCHYAPKWITKLRVYRYREQNTTIDPYKTGALEEAVRLRGLERGPLFYELERRSAPKIPPRLFGSAEIRGKGNALIIVSRFDENIMSRAGDAYYWGNSISFQICKPKLDGTDSVIWAKTMLKALCEQLHPWHAYALMCEEFDAKNISHERGGTMAIGVDVSRSLPGLYWLNFFGLPYRELIGRERLLSAPADEVAEIDQGVMLALHREPKAWNTPKYKHTESCVLQFLGQQYFFSRDDPARKTIAPSFPLP